MDKKAEAKAEAKDAKAAKAKDAEGPMDWAESVSSGAVYVATGAMGAYTITEWHSPAHGDVFHLTFVGPPREPAEGDKAGAASDLPKVLGDFASLEDAQMIAEAHEHPKPVAPAKSAQAPGLP